MIDVIKPSLIRGGDNTTAAIIGGTGVATLAGTGAYVLNNANKQVSAMANKHGLERIGGYFNPGLSRKGIEGLKKLGTANNEMRLAKKKIMKTGKIGAGVGLGLTALGAYKSLK